MSERRRRLAIALSIGTLLFLAYLLTFAGAINSDDELFIIDTTDSLAIRGSLLLNETVYLRGLQTSDVEPAQPILAIPLYWLAYHTPWVGNVHAIFLFNPIITALTGLLIFFYALDLGYGERTALIAALLFGLATIAWPYTKTFFREPLTTFNLLGAAFFLNRWRTAFAAEERRCWLWLGLGIAVTLIALLSKEATLIALPFLFLLAYPGREPLSRHRREVLLLGLGLVILAVVFASAILFYREQLEAVTGRYVIRQRVVDFIEGLPDAWYPTLGYLFSPGKGIFWYSPVTLLALGGPFVLPRRRWRESWLPLAFTLWFAFSYGAVRQELWHGGAGWGPRYMVPLTPFLVLAALPLLERILDHKSTWPRLALGVLVLGALAVQLGGTYVNIHSYYAYQQAATGLVPWHDTIIWSVRWSQAIGSLLYLPQAETDLLWLIPQPDWPVVTLIMAGLGLVGGVLLPGLRQRGDVRPGHWRCALLMPLVAAALGVFALWRAYDDPRYEGHNEALHALRSDLASRTTPDDIIMLSSPSYVPYFMNYYKGRATWYSLPLSPGERYSPEQEPEVVSDRVEDLIAPVSVSMINSTMPGGVLYNGHPIWLVVDNSPFLPWTTRPAEWYLTKYAYQVEATDFSPLVRLVSYLPLRAPLPDDEPAHPLEARFGPSIRFVGYDLSTNRSPAEDDDTPLHPGDMLGLSLLWEATGGMNTDYTVGVYFINEAGQLVLQQDRQPVGGFAPTSRWQPGRRYRDNFGFILPPDLPPGRYDLWVAVYNWPSLERLPVTLSGQSEQSD
ncbi:MAG TPA: hypothetical protein ENI95_04805, partial [Chloroflexi bacterium]|nr:hypothetical protein [Chloroflexota bacterium]